MADKKKYNSVHIHSNYYVIPAKEPKEKKVNKDKRSDYTSPLLSIFAVIVLLIIAFNIPSLIRNDGSISYIFSFERFMNMLTEVPTIDVKVVTNFISTISADWGTFNFLRDFINVFINIFSGVACIAVGIVQLVTFLVYFIPYIFGF